jgi:hypothetical protein
MAMNLDAVLRISAKVLGIEELSKLEKAISGTEKTAKDASAAFSAVAGSKIWQVAAAGATAFLGGMVLATKAAIDFESSMSDVRKVVSGIETPEAFAEISAEILQLSNQMPIAANGFAQIYAAAGQSGIAREGLREFAVVVAETAIAFEMTAEEAGKALAQMRSSLGLTTPELRVMAGAINELTNQSNGYLSAPGLVDFVTRVGSMGKIAGFTGQQMAAFGAVMMQNGQQSEVAATGFRGLITALSKGPAMTDRQVDALRRLGFEMASAKQIEQELTRAAETESRRRVDDARRHKDEVVRVAQDQSDRRLEIARNETDQLSKEINRRFRDELTALQDGWEDQAKAQEDAFRDRADAQIKALQRQERAEIDHVQKVARAQGSDASAAVDRIRDAYESRIDAVRDQLDRELTVQRRAARDQQTIVRDQIDDRKDLELKANADRFEAIQAEEEKSIDAVKRAADERFKAVEQAEKAFMEMSKANAKKTGEERAKADLLAFSKTFNQNAASVTADVLNRLRALPREELISTLTDFGGEETARGVAVLVDNMDQLSEAMRIATNDSENASSITDEYAVKAQTTAAQLQLMQNQLQNMATVIGQSALPELLKLSGALKPVLEGITQFAQANPQLTTFLVAVGTTAAAVVLALPLVAAFLTSLAKIKGFLAGGAIVGALKTFVGAFAFAITKGLIPLFLGFVGWIGTTFLPAVIALFSGPVGWTVLEIGRAHV